MNRRTSRNKPRSASGGILVLAVIVLAFVVIPAWFFFSKCGLLVETQSRYQSNMEAASLLAAERLSKIVVIDPHFGFISLSNQPPIGKATLAEDGEPCPVTSINNLFATVRLDTIIAHEMNNDDMCALADADYKQMKRAEELLQSSLQSAVNPEDRHEWSDMNGNEISAYGDALALLETNLRSNNGGRPVAVRDFRVSLGWLKRGGTTNTSAPAPLSWEHLSAECQQGGKYKSGVDIPAFGKSFIFASVAPTPALADQSMFSEPDGKRFCSVVKVEADIEDSNLFDAKFGREKWLHISACAVPPEHAQVGPTGALMVFFPIGPADALRSLSDVLHLQDGQDKPARFYQAVDGDLPVDSEASTAPTQLEPWEPQDINSNRVVAAGLYCWLRASGVKPRIDSTLNAMTSEFSRSLKSSNLLYEFDPHGNVTISSLPAMPLPISVLSDQQVFVETRGDNYSICCYNNVYNLGTIKGGKHAGQPLAGDPINWCDLPYFGLSAESARADGKGAATGLTVVSNKWASGQIPGAVDRDDAEFQFNGKRAAVQPRQSYYSGGVAVELSISAFGMN